MTTRPVPVGILITVAFLALYGAFSFWLAWQQRSWSMAALGVAAALACVQAARLRRWSRFLIYALAAGFSSVWLYSVYAAARAGYFAPLTRTAMIRSLAHGVALLAVAGFCSYMVHRHFGAPRSGADDRG